MLSMGVRHLLTNNLIIFCDSDIKFSYIHIILLIVKFHILQKKNLSNKSLCMPSVSAYAPSQNALVPVMYITKPCGVFATFFINLSLDYEYGLQLHAIVKLYNLFSYTDTYPSLTPARFSGSEHHTFFQK